MDQPSNPLKLVDDVKIVLASKSPRRRQLLQQLGLDFTVDVPANVSEAYDPTQTAAIDVAPMLARRKAKAYSAERFATTGGNILVIAADTTVVVDDQVLGKPSTKAEAISMLRKLSGRKHRVVSGVAIEARIDSVQSSLQASATTIVEFATLTEQEIRYYVDLYNPSDKAGAYGIQEWIGMIGIERIEGDFYNVMGLPVHTLYGMLKSLSA